MKKTRFATEKVATERRSGPGSWIALTTTGALIAGLLVASGVGAQTALANPFAPKITVENDEKRDFILAGEDAAFNVSASNRGGGKQFNLGLSALVPESVTFVNGGYFGDPIQYGPEEELPTAAGISAADCSGLGLIPASQLTPAGGANSCAVPAGQQLWVWSNVSDLPDGAEVLTKIKVRPDATVYPAGSEISFDVNAYTSDDPTRLPVFAGSPSRSTKTSHTSSAGRDETFDRLFVKALRVSVSEPSEESELLRGAHTQSTTYTVRLENTGQAPTGDVVIANYLPAGLEYLGTNGGDQSIDEEYPGSGSIPGGWIPSGERVETVELSAEEAAKLGVGDAGVYTRVTWSLKEPLVNGTPQLLPETPGTAGVTEFSYRAAVPLFENARWAEGTEPDPNSTLQAANLDNNTGASTRHGGADPESPAEASILGNTATATGNYTGAVRGNDAALRQSSDHDTETVQAVDLRVLKTVAADKAGNAFASGKLATYSLDVAASEYVNAREIRLTDVMPNGLCPAIPKAKDAPKLTIKSGDAVQDLSADPAKWSSIVGGGSVCSYPNTDAGATLNNASVASIEYNAQTGNFTSVFRIDSLAASERLVISYTAMQRPLYSGGKGATSSGDKLSNRVDITGVTSPIDAIAKDKDLAERVGGDRFPRDGSQATISSNFSGLTATVLERGIAPEKASEADWKKQSETPFSAGDSVWYRVSVPFARGIETRNAVLDDYLPEGIDYVGVKYGYSGIPGFADVTKPTAHEKGSGFPTEFVSSPSESTGQGGALNHLSWTFGRELKGGNGDRFMPRDSSVTIYIEGRVSTQSSTALDVDSLVNQAKYQQANVDGVISFLRDDARINLDWGATLEKGIKTNSHPGGSTDEAFNKGGTEQQVVQGDGVVYRLDVTAPQNTTGGYVVWDVLPAGVTKEDVRDFTAALYNDGAETPLKVGPDFKAVVYDAAKIPAGGPQLSKEYAGRSVVIWKLNRDIAGSDADPAITRGFTLGYTLTTPDGTGGAAARIVQNYENTAGIVSYEIPNGLGSKTATVVPEREGGGQELTNRKPGKGEIGIDDAGTFDAASVYLPNAVVAERLVSTEITPAQDEFNSSLRSGAVSTRPDDAVVQGEYATFEYSVTIPGRTSVSGAELSNSGRFSYGPGNGQSVGYEFVAGSARFTGPTKGFDFDAAGFTALGSDRGQRSAGTLVFPKSYTNTTSKPQTFSVQITAWVKDRDANNQVPDLADNTALVNTADFTFDNPNVPEGNLTVSGSTQLRYIEPALGITKSASPSSGVSADAEVVYTLTLSNNAARPRSSDNTVVDTVPAGLFVDTSQAALAGATFDDAKSLREGRGGKITWTPKAFPQLAAVPSNITLKYSVRTDPDTGGGRTYVNRAEVTGYTLPSAASDASSRRGVRSGLSFATITAATAGVQKSVRIAPSTDAYTKTASAPIGATAQYRVDITLRPNINYYDVRIEDVLPTGAILQNATISGPTLTPSDAQINDPKNWQLTNPVGTTQRWSYTANGGDFGQSSEPRTLSLSYDVLLSNSTSNIVNSFRNTARFSWAPINGDSARQLLQDSATITVLNPVLNISKKVAGADSVTRDPDATLPYSLTVTNTGSTPAYRTTVTDTIPNGIIVDEATISDGGKLTGVGANGGGTITWQLNRALDPQSGPGSNKEFVLDYSATFTPSSKLRASATGLGNELINTADVTRFESFENGGRVYTPGQGSATAVRDRATARPAFPSVILSKAASDGTVAHVGEPFGWKLTVVNTGQGSADTITVTDVLPKNWSYDPDSARISVGGAPAALLGAPTRGSEGGKSTLSWELESAQPGTPLLPGTSSGATLAARTVEITLSATPTAAATSDAGVGINVNPHTNSLRAVTTDTTGAKGNATTDSYTGGPATASAFLGSADLAVTTLGAQDPIVAGTSGTGWKVRVENRGKDPADGPILVTGTTDPLPDGITVTGATGDGWNCELSTRGVDGATALSCARSSIAETLASGAMFPEISVNVSLAADQAPVTVENTITVSSGRTFDPKLSNNESSAEISTSVLADLALVKMSNTVAPNAGAAITWQLAPRNLGPSVSQSTADAPITVTDTIPAGVNGVNYTEASGSWTATPPASGVWNAGDTITWNYTGDTMPLGASPVITLSGVIDASLTGETITNSALIRPGNTPDPGFVGDPGSEGYSGQNNLGSVTIEPGDGTTLGIAKTRVVWDGASSSWVAAPEGSEISWGDTVSFRLAVVNSGLADARGVTVLDEVPEGLSYLSHVSESGSWSRSAGGTNAAGTSNASWDTFVLDEAQQPGVARSVVVSYASDEARDPDTVIRNWTEASAVNATNAPRDEDSSDSTRLANLSVVKSHSGSAVAGGTLDYSIAATNHGSSVSDGAIVMTDELPSGFSYVPGSAWVSIAGGARQQIEPEISGQDLSWTPLAAGSTLASGATIEITLTTAIAADQRAQVGLVNRATVRAPNDPDPSDNFWNDATDVVEQSDMLITNQLSPESRTGPWVAGSTVSYTLNMWNNGPSVADATVTNLLPTGMTLVSASSDSWDCSAATAGSSVMECGLESHPVTAVTDEPTAITVVAEIDASVPTGTTLTNAAVLSWSDSRGIHSGEARADITVTALADLDLIKTAIDLDGEETELAFAGEYARYRLNAHSHGPSNAAPPIIETDTMPEGVSFVGLTEGSSAFWDVTVDDTNPQRLVFALKQSDVGLADESDAPPIVYDVLLEPGLRITDDVTVSPLVNTATITSGTPEPGTSQPPVGAAAAVGVVAAVGVEALADPGNSAQADSTNNTNTDTAALDVGRATDLAITKTHDAAAVRIGGELDFTMTVDNRGPSVSSGVRVTDAVPAGLRVLSAPGDAGDGWNIESVTADASGATDIEATYRGEILVGESAPPLIVATEVTPLAEPSMFVVAEVSPVDERETDRTRDGNVSENEVRVPPLATLLVEKAAVGEFKVGDTGRYAITVKNLGPTEDPGPITVTDALPEGLSYVSATGGSGRAGGAGSAQLAVKGSTVTWTLPDGLAVNEEVTLRLVVRVGQVSYPSVTNVATVDSAAEKTPESQLSDEATVAVAAAGGLPRTGGLSITGSDLGALAVLAALLLLLLCGAGLLLKRRRARGA